MYLKCVERFAGAAGGAFGGGGGVGLAGSPTGAGSGAGGVWVSVFLTAGSRYLGCPCKEFGNGLIGLQISSLCCSTILVRMSLSDSSFTMCTSCILRR